MHKFTLFKLTCILISILLTSSCVLTGFQSPKIIDTTQTVPLPANKQHQSIIFLTRPFKYSQALINYMVSDNGNDIGVLTNSSYMNWETNAGDVTLILKPSVSTQCYTYDDECRNENVDLTNIKTSRPHTRFTFNVIAGNTYYLTLNPQSHFFTNTPGKVDVEFSDSIDLTNLKQPVIDTR